MESSINSLSYEGELVYSASPVALPNKCSLEDIIRLEKALLATESCDTSGGEVESYFSDGLYARKLTLPAGSTAVGKMHLQGQINFLLKGTVRVTTDNGEVKTLTAPDIIVSKAGTKRACHALTETVWVTVSHTSKKTVDEVEADIIASSTDDPRLEGILCLGQQ